MENGEISLLPTPKPLNQICSTWRKESKSGRVWEALKGQDRGRVSDESDTSEKLSKIYWIGNQISSRILPKFYF